MDLVDRQMLHILQRDGRISNAALADQLHLSPSPCLRRLRALERDGVIEGYRAVLDRKTVGLGLTVFVELKVDGHSDKTAAAIKRELEEALPKTFKLDSELIAVIVLTRAQLQGVVRKRPKGFGDKPDTYHSDAVFLMDIDATSAMKVFDPRPGVDEVWPGTGVIYSQRLSAQRTKSRLGKIVGTPAYKSMTIRSWATTIALLERMEAPEAEADA